MSTQTFSDAIRIRTADREMFPTVPAAVDMDRYAVLTDDSGSWILTTAKSAYTLDIEALPGASLTDDGAAEYGEFWSSIAENIDVLGDCNNPLGAAAALCAREGVEMIEQD